MLSTSLFMALAMKCAPSVHPDTLHDIARVESSFRPLAIAVIGGESIYPKSMNDAISHIERLKQEKKKYSIGLMQIYRSNFKKFGVTEKELFDPCVNLSVAEKILVDCYKRGKTLARMTSCYYSGNFTTGLKPEKEFNNTSYVQRIGYLVPSTKQDKQAVTVHDLEPTANINYPAHVIRGVLPENETLSNTFYPPYIVRGKLTTPMKKE
ncbi:lytic transglycosylase domain-containing protein [Salmonella enterica]|nr:lytic transglycosylase domain-containing protein [Salmonella enterica]